MKAQNVHPAHPDFISAPPAKFDSAPGAEQTRGGAAGAVSEFWSGGCDVASEAS